MENVPGLSKVTKQIESRGALLCLSLSGSKAYGLDNENSDFDLLGVYQAPTAQLLQLIGGPEETIHRANQVCPACVNRTNCVVDGQPVFTCPTCNGTGQLPDFTVHELGKFFSLASKANPTILELLYLDSLKNSPKWQLVLENRDMFISTAIRRTYGGYAKDQLNKKRLREKQGMDGYSPKTRYRDSKHTRHIVRLFIQQRQILETGGIIPMLNDEEKTICMDAMEWDSEKLEEWMNEQTISLLNINHNVKPEPDHKRINEILLELRGL